jgi:hypothetical protein
MRTYTVESDFREIWLERIKNVAHFPWIAIGTVGSVILLGVLLLRTIPQQSQQFTWTLGPYESQVLPLPQSMLFARRTVEVQGNADAVTLYWTRNCPTLEEYENEVLHERIEGFFQGKLQKDIFLLKNSIATLKLDNADGPIEVTVFSNWDDEREFERRPKDNLQKILKSDTADSHRTVELEILSAKTDRHVFLFQGRRGQSADTTYFITRRRYNLEFLIPIADSSCSYQKCQVVRNTAGCFTLESTMPTRDVSFQVNVVVKHYPGWMVLVSFLPLLIALIYAKWHRKAAIDPSQRDQYQTGNSSAGYELVLNSADETF